MAYVLVMGGLALSVSFTLGWLLWRSARALWGAVGRPKTPGRARPRTNARAGKAPPARRAATPRGAAKPRPRRPWRLTRWLSRRRSALPLATLSLLLYAVARVVEFGMTRRPQVAPPAYHGLVEGLGWLAAALLAAALINLLARWRCRGVA